MIFHGVRTKDDRPVCLYSTPNRVDDGEAMVLNQSGFTCPGDSPVKIWGVSAFGSSDLSLPSGAAWQIIGPDEREWFKNRIRNNITNLGDGFDNNVPQGVLDARWISHRWEWIELGEEKGWMMGNDETFVVEVGVNTPVTATDTEFYIAMVTLRGFMEVNHG